jgi:protein CpxP
MKKLGKFKIPAIISLSALVLVGSIALAQSVKTRKGDGEDRGAWRGRGMHGHDGEMDGMFLHKLNLTDDQKAKLKQMHESFAATNKPLFDQLHAKREELRQMNEGGTFDEALATQKLTEMAGLEAKMMGARFSLHQQMLSLLTTEQKTQLDQMKAQFKSRHDERRENQ